MDEKKILNGIKKFNRYRSPEAKAELLSLNSHSFTVKITGIFSTTCGFYDYFEDLKIFLEEEGLKVKIEKVTEIEKGAIIRYKIANTS